MQPSEFKSHMDRLAEQFKNTYSQARVELIWREVRDFDAYWWGRLVDKLLGECRHSPLLPEIREAMSIERERSWSRQKQHNAQEAREFFLIADDTEARKSTLATILRRVQGRVPDDEWKQFVHGITSLGTRTIACRSCSGTGLVFLTDAEDYEWTYRCRCASGKRQPQLYVVAPEGL